MKDALETLGTLIDDDAARDAIHVAVEPVTAIEQLYPGQRIGLVSGGAGQCDEPIGIVDPFLSGVVSPGQRFWMLLFPRTITSLRHVWAHPAFGELPPATDAKAVSEQWLRDFVARSECPDYETVIAEAVNQNNNSWNDEALHFGQDACGDIPAEFWTHVEIVTGRKIENRPTYFSCSC